jgi:hypothetical protein
VVCILARAVGQAFFRKIGKFEFLHAAGRGQWQFRGTDENHMSRNLETGEPGGAKLNEFLRVGKDLSGGNYARAPDFAHHRGLA